MITLRGTRMRVIAMTIVAVLGLACVSTGSKPDPKNTDDWEGPVEPECEAVAPGPTRWVDARPGEVPDWTEIAGEYRLVLVAAAGAPPGTRSSGLLMAWTNDSTHQKYSVWHEIQPDLPIIYPLYGAVDSTFIWPPWTGLLTAPTSRNPDWPAFQFKYVIPTGRLSVVVSNPTNPRIAIEDAPSVYLDVAEIGSDTMRGRWNYGGLVLEGPEKDWGWPEGHFCMWKLK